MKWLHIAAIAIFATVSIAVADVFVLFGQSLVLVDYNKGLLAWDAPTVCTGLNTPIGCGGTPEVYHVKCGDSTGVYNHPVVDIAAPRTQIEVRLIVPSIGTYFCTMSVGNQFGESPDNGEVHFTAGILPGAATNLRVIK